jgi:hypothetical protein
MDIQELKKQSFLKVLLQGRSGRGKTRTACVVVLKSLSEGATVKYVDTESEGSTTLVQLIDQLDYDEDVVEGLDYEQVGSYESFKSAILDGEDYDVTVVDTLDHKHSFVLKEVSEAKTAADADWNEYPQIYSHEKELMETVSKLQTNVIATIDPDSGKDNKPKGAQTNVMGYFNIVASLYRDGNDWSHTIDNWVGRSDLIGGEIASIELHEAISAELEDRIEV